MKGRYYLSLESQEVYQWALAHKRFMLTYLAFTFLMMLLVAYSDISRATIVGMTIIVSCISYWCEGLLVKHYTYGAEPTHKTRIAEVSNMLMIVVENTVMICSLAWFKVVNAANPDNMLFILICIGIALAVCLLRLVLSALCGLLIKNKACIGEETKTTIKTEAGEDSLSADEVILITDKIEVYDKSKLKEEPLRTYDIRGTAITIKPKRENGIVITESNYKELI